MSESVKPQPSNAAFRRAVFFIAGFDPNGAQYLYWLFRREFAKDCALHVRKAAVGRLVEDSDKLPGWRIETADGATPVTVDYSILSPRRVVLEHYYIRDVFCLIAAYFFVVYSLFRTGAHRYLLRAPAPAIAVLAFIFLAVPGFFWIGTGLAYWPMLLLPESVGAAPRLVARLLGGLAVLQGVIVFEHVIWLYFFVSALRLAALQAQERAHALDRMVADWVRIVAGRQAKECYDEVVVVGHSVGSIQAIEMAERLLQDAAFAGTNRLSLLTVGSADGLLSSQRNARRFHAATAAVATAPELAWIEYYAPTDAICRGGTDPIAFAGIDLGGRKQTGPEMRRIDLRAMFKALSLSRLPLNLVKQHFIYLTCGDRITDFSYFRTICRAGRLS